MVGACYIEIYNGVPPSTRNDTLPEVFSGDIFAYRDATFAFCIIRRKTSITENIVKALWPFGWTIFTICRTYVKLQPILVFVVVIKHYFQLAIWLPAVQRLQHGRVAAPCAGHGLIDNLIPNVC